jgi:phage-related protein
MNENKYRPVRWIGSSRKDLKEFPEEVQDMVGYALFAVQDGKKPRESKPLHGFGPGVLEIVSNYDSDTYRAVYTVRLTHRVYVLHCFQKKSKHGIKTPQKEIALIKQRLNMAIEQDKKAKE